MCPTPHPPPPGYDRVKAGFTVNTFLRPKFTQSQFVVSAKRQRQRRDENRKWKREGRKRFCRLRLLTLNEPAREQKDHMISTSLHHFVHGLVEVNGVTGMTDLRPSGHRFILQAHLILTACDFCNWKVEAIAFQTKGRSQKSYKIRRSYNNLNLIFAILPATQQANL